MNESDVGLTVSGVASQLPVRLEAEVRKILNDLEKAGTLTMQRGAGGYQSMYYREPFKAASLQRRF